jgi:hypothetical protein
MCICQATTTSDECRPRLTTDGFALDIFHALSCYAQVPVLFQKAQEAGAVTSLDPQFDACEKWDSGIHDIFPHLDLLKVSGCTTCTWFERVGVCLL